MVLIPANMSRFGFSPYHFFFLVFGPCKYVSFWFWSL